MPARRKPPQRHIADGTQRADRRHFSAPGPACGAPNKPPSVAARSEASLEWDRIVPLLVEKRTLTATDAFAVAAYCGCVADYVAVEAIKAEPGFRPVMPSTTRAGTSSMRPHPAVSAGIRIGTELRHWSTQLGLTPISRSQVIADPPAATSSELDAFVERGRRVRQTGRTNPRLVERIDG